jgi:hypothetical protein
MHFSSRTTMFSAFSNPRALLGERRNPFLLVWRYPSREGDKESFIEA